MGPTVGEEGDGAAFRRRLWSAGAGQPAGQNDPDEASFKSGDLHLCLPPTPAHPPDPRTPEAGGSHGGGGTPAELELSRCSCL